MTLRRSLALVLMAALAAPGIAGASLPSSPSLRTSRVRGRLQTVSCMSRTLCLAAGITHGQGYPVELELIRSGRVIHAWNFKRYPGSASIACPTDAGCYAVSTDGVETSIVSVSSAGELIQHVLRPASKAAFDSISCVSATRCELAGQVMGGSIAVASWNGQRLGSVHTVNLPDESGFGNYQPQVSCAGAWCEEGADIYVPGEEEQDIYALYLTTLHNGIPVRSQWVNGYMGSVACGNATACYAVLTSSSTPGQWAIARVAHGSVSTPTAYALAGYAIACQGKTCMTVDANELTFFSSGRPVAERTVHRSRVFAGAGTGPGGVLAAVGADRSTGSVLTVAR